jgi:hypothetical protein
MQRTAQLVAQHDKAIRARSLAFWNGKLKLGSLREFILYGVVAICLFRTVSDAFALHDLANRVIVTERIRETDRYGQVLSSTGATYAFPVDSSRHKLLHDFLSCVFQVVNDKATMQNWASDCTQMTIANSDASDQVIAYWSKHSPLRPDGSWLSDLAIPSTLHVTSYLGPRPTGKNGAEEWTVQFTLNGSNNGVRMNDLYTTDITLVPHAAPTDVDPFGLTIGEFTWDKLR